MALAATGALTLAGATVAAVGAGGPAALAAPAAAAADTIEWGACEAKPLADRGAECGFVEVPLDWSKPSGKQIQIAVSRVKATASTRQGVMLTNPGGPGGSGLILPAFLPQRVPDGAGAQFDWIGFDPRGVGSSKPALSCDPDYFNGPRPAYRPATQARVGADEKAWIARTKAYAKACAKENGALLSNVRTIDTIRDMDAIRAALGEKKINYYGFSYGTYLGQVYASRHPDRVGRMVFDGNVPPDYAGYGDGGRSQMVGFENVIQQFFAWVASHEDVYGLGSTREAVEKAYYAEEAALTAEPVQEIGPAEWNDVFLLAGYSESRWPAVADAFADWLSGDRASVQRLYEATASPGDDNSFAVFNATFCTDGDFPSDYDEVRKDAFSIAEDAPFLSWGGFWYSGPCTFWPVESGEELTVDGSKVSTPILLINATDDGATPYSGALAVREEFPSSALVAEEGSTTHSGSLRGNACIDDTIARYLASGELPERNEGNTADASCERLPLPQPSLLNRGMPSTVASAAGNPAMLTGLLSGLPLPGLG